ncbi:Hypothetical_protein [Hexamita inflata]|uniref:Hypothetical_protein n=1 Tax=Hexamita inflata TaxID=28002 RepID=A0AA86PP87_9EUKA|nr:Hypothetical protein HINF_LOCUS26257 [Hexamita inflata]
MDQKDIDVIIDLCSSSVDISLGLIKMTIPGLSTFNSSFSPRGRTISHGFVNKHVNEFTYNDVQTLLTFEPDENYKTENSQRSELLLEKLLFESQEMLRKIITTKTTMRHVNGDTGFKCVYVKRKKDKRDYGQQEYKSIKNKCSRTAGIWQLQGSTIFRKKKRYSEQYEFLIDQNGKIEKYDDFDSSATYYFVRFYHNHDKSNPCQFILIKSRSQFTQKQLELINWFEQNHRFESFKW